MSLPNLAVSLTESDTYEVRTVVDSEDLKLAEFTTADAAFDFIRDTSDYMLLYDIFSDVYVLMYGDREIARSADPLLALLVVVKEQLPDEEDLATDEPVPYVPADFNDVEFTCSQCNTINTIDTADGDRCFNCGDSRHNPHPNTYEETSHV